MIKGAAFDGASRRAVAATCGLLALGLGVGFLVLPNATGGAFNPWDSICRAVGLGGLRGTAGPVASSPPASGVAWTRAEVVRATGGDANRGADVALSCDGCHGSAVVAAQTVYPSLAGMDRLSFTKQMADYAAGRRANPVMQAFGAALSPDQVADAGAFYAAQPLPPGTGTPGDTAAERLIARGDDARALAPCASCHGSNNRSPGMASLNGLSADYLAGQLDAWRTGGRGNDLYGVMGSVARALTPAEVRAVSVVYAARQPGG